MRRTSAATKVVRYHGYRLVVPASWPVYDLAADPAVCVRFNRHAVYLGQPSSRQRCPAHSIGRTEAILVAPLAAHGAGAGGAAVRTRASGRGQPERPAPSRVVGPAGDPVLRRACDRDMARRSARSWRGRSVSPRSLRWPRQDAAQAHLREGSTGSLARAGDPVYTGLGFDACSTPSSSTMSAWGASPFRAVGVYIGGANEACSQPNLSPTWVEQESAAGWVLLPIYVGLQAPNNGCGCAGIVPSQASAEGTAAADDAINQAEANGISPGNPIYDDMEAYTRGSRTRRGARVPVGVDHRAPCPRLPVGRLQQRELGHQSTSSTPAAPASSSPTRSGSPKWNGQQNTEQLGRPEHRLGQPPAHPPVPGRPQRHLRRRDDQHRQRLRGRRRRLRRPSCSRTARSCR